MSENYHCRYDSSIGELLLTSDGRSVTGLYMSPFAMEGKGDQNPSAFDDLRVQLDDYFAGRRRTFDVPLNLTGTAFQKSVWSELTRIPFGATISYGELARRIGNANASRAVGLANGKNPISIVVPCHRVIGANGTLTGYGGGLDRKKWLLEHEAKGIILG